MSSPGAVQVREGGALARIDAAFRASFMKLRRPPGGVPPRVAWRTIALLAAFGVVLFFMSALWLDESAIRAARALPAWVRDVFRFLTDFGKSGWMLWPLAGFFVVAVGASPWMSRGPRLVVASLAVRAAFLFCAIGAPGLFAAIIKRFIGRARPFVGGDANAWLYDPFNGAAAYASMPSGHSTTAFAAAFAVGALWPRTRVVMWIYALIIAFSRVVVTAHHPSDVLTGAFVGIFGALLVRNYFAALRLAFGVADDGSVTPFSGPSWPRLKSVARSLRAD